MADKKLFLGARLKRLRRDFGLTQTRMAEDLGVSPSYLNLLERNQRPVTAQVLLRLAEAYDLDFRSLASDPDPGGADDLGEIFADPLFRDLVVPRHELTEIATSAPAVAEGVVRLYRAYLDQRRLADLGGAGRPEEGGGVTPTPSDWVRDFIQAQKNHFPELEEAAESRPLEAGPLGAATAALERLEARGVKVQVVPASVLPESLRRFDHHRRRLYLSERLGASSRAFALAYQLGVLEHGELLDALVTRAAAPDRSTRSLLRVSMANYLAAALLMPYARFHDAAERSGYDLDLLCARFGTSFEQASQRLTTLSRPGARGVEFFMIRVDAAGNVSKRYAGGAFPFSRFGGTCPRWNLHSCFQVPGQIVKQVIETPDGRRFFTLARTVSRTGEGAGELAVGLGCDLKHAERLVYGRSHDLASAPATAIGPACRICERPACPQRAAEPINRTLMVDDFTRSISPYPFVAD